MVTRLLSLSRLPKRPITDGRYRWQVIDINARMVALKRLPSERADYTYRSYTKLVSLTDYQNNYRRTH